MICLLCLSPYLGRGDGGGCVMGGMFAILYCVALFRRV